MIPWPLLGKLILHLAIVLAIKLFLGDFQHNRYYRNAYQENFFDVTYQQQVDSLLTKSK